MRSIASWSGAGLLILGTMTLGIAHAEKAPQDRREYRGVREGGTPITPPGARKGEVGKNRIYWIGFSPKEGGASRVFVQTGVEPKLSQWVEGTTLYVHLEGARIAHRSVARRLDTRFFDTSLKRVKARASGRRVKGVKRKLRSGTLIAIEFKNPVDVREADVQTETGEDGFHYLHLDFPPGTDMPDGSQGSADDNSDPADEIDE